MTTRNIQLMATEVAQHIAADAVIQGIYWVADEHKGCFIGCLGHSNDPAVAAERFGLTLPLLRIAESIFEGLPADEARDFFAAFPGAIGCDGRDLSLVHWKFLAVELRALPLLPADVQAVINFVIEGMDLLASGQEWPAAADAAQAAADAAQATTCAARVAARAVAYAADAAVYAADADAAWSAAYAAWAADADAAWSAAAANAWAAADDDAADAARAAARTSARRRQRDLLLSLIRQAPVSGVSDD